jgi:AraC-like DNA-binding protein
MESMALPISTLADIALRGGAASISVLVAILLLAIRPVREVTLFGALFLLGAATYSIIGYEPVHAILGSWHIPLKLFAILSPSFFWLFIMALFDDGFHFRARMAAPLAAMGGLFLSCLPFPAVETVSKLAQFSITLVLMAHVIVLTRRSLRDDLVDSRRQFSSIVAILVPAVCLAIGVIEVYELLDMRAEGTNVISAILFVVSAGFALGIAGIRKSLLPEFSRPRRTSVSGHPAADRFDLARLEELMKDGVYLHSGLTIGELAGRMNIPEHRLRRLINKGLGYRNFAAFINDHRIEEAARRLSEPKTAREQITSLAFDLGYSSLAPFNRAFRERLGMSPSQYREKALSAVEA